MTLSKHLQLALALTYLCGCLCPPPGANARLAEVLSGQEFCAYGPRGPGAGSGRRGQAPEGGPHCEQVEAPLVTGVCLPPIAKCGAPRRGSAHPTQGKWMDQSEGAEGDTEPWVGAAGPAASPPPGPLLPGLHSHSRLPSPRIRQLMLPYYSSTHQSHRTKFH